MQEDIPNKKEVDMERSVNLEKSQWDLVLVGLYEAKMEQTTPEAEQKYDDLIKLIESKLDNGQRKNE